MRKQTDKQRKVSVRNLNKGQIIRQINFLSYLLSKGKITKKESIQLKEIQNLFQNIITEWKSVI